MRHFLIVTFLYLLVQSAQAQLVSTVAGKTDTTGTADGTGTNATFNSPHGIACDRYGNVYVADRFNHKIRKIAPGNVVSTLAGSGNIGGFDGTGTAATFYEPWGLACDTSGNVYVADTKNYKIRKITPGGVVTTIAGTGTFGTTNGPALLAKFGFPTGICVTDDGTIYVADHQTHTIRKIANGTVSTIAGTAFMSGSNDGLGTAASFNRPYGIDLDQNGDILVADEWNHLIRKVTPAGMVTTLAGVGIIGSADGQAMSAMFNYPWDVTVDPSNNIFVADGYNYTVRKITAGPFPIVSTFAGSAGIPGAVNGFGPQASFDGATGIAFNPADFTYYIGDAYNNLVRNITVVSSIQITLSSNHSNNVFCSGDSILLSSNPSNLSNYQFFEGNTLLGSSANGMLALSGLPSGSHTIHCTATDSSGALVLSSLLNLTVSPAINVQISPAGPYNICNGDTLFLSANAGYQYLWSTGSTSQTLQVLAAGTYTCTLTNTYGCSALSSPATVTLKPGPTAVISPAGPVTACPGDTVTLTAGGGNVFLWSTGSTSQSVIITTPGNYTVQVEDSSGCSAVSNAAVVNYYAVTPASITPSGYVILIAGDSAQLTASSGNSYLWSNGATTSSVFAGDSGTYMVTVTDVNGCTSVSPVVLVITITSGTLVTVIGSATFCESDSVLLSSNLQTGNQWYVNGSPIPGATTAQYYATASGYYYDVVTQTNGTFIQSDSIQVVVNPAPSNPVVTDATICEGESALLTVQPDSGTVFNWFDLQTGGTLLYTGTGFQTPVLTQTTGYFVEATGSNGCVNRYREIVQAIVIPKPQAGFTHLIQSGGNSGFMVSFSSSLGNGYTHYWNFGDSVSSDNVSLDVNPSHHYATAGIYTVLLVISNQAGCSDTILQTITVAASSNIFIPTSFTPNLDGANDLFRVRGPGIMQVEMRIYNQWGELIYHNSGPDATWNGGFKGRPVQNATYAYDIELVMDNGTREKFSGHISVIR